MKLTCLFSSLFLLSFLQVAHAASIRPVSAKRDENAKVAATWFAGWHATSTPAFPVSNITWSKYTHVTYSFAETSPDVTYLNLSGSNPDVLPQFVATAHQNGVKALASIGGWAGSRWWSTNVGSAVNRTLFVKTVTDFANKYQLDGLDFDWEFPANQGIGCNAINPQDTANFLAFIEELRNDPTGKNLILTAATLILPFYGPDGKPSKNVAGFADVLDWIAVMNYDVWGPWSPTVGPNSPLDDSCAPSAKRIGSATSAVQAWEAAGIPRNKIVLGVGSYGHSFRVKSADAYTKQGDLALYPPFVKDNQPAGDIWDAVSSGTDVCGNPLNPEGGINFWGLISLGYLGTDGQPREGIDYIFDDCSKTAYVYNKTSEVMVSYDDAEAFWDKGEFIRTSEIRGFSMWEAGGDYEDILLDAIRLSVGYEK